MSGMRAFFHRVWVGVYILTSALYMVLALTGPAYGWGHGGHGHGSFPHAPHNHTRVYRQRTPHASWLRKHGAEELQARKGWRLF